MAKSQPYPRGLPFQSPEPGPANCEPQPRKPGPEAHALAAQLQELHDRELQLRRWLLATGVGMLGVMLLTVIGCVLFVNRAMKRLDLVAVPPPARAGVPATAASEPVPQESRQEAFPALGGNLPALPAALTGAVPLEPTNPAEALPERALEVVGGLTAGHLFQSYLNLGMLADSVENKVYTKEEGKKLLGTVLALMNTVDQQLARLAGSVQDMDDQKRIARVRQLTALLRAQAKELQAYWETPDAAKEARKEHETKFHKAREEAWAGIKDLLEIKED